MGGSSCGNNFPQPRESESERAAMWKPIGFCCAFVSVFGIILLGVLWWAESNYTTMLGSHCKKGSSDVCTAEVEHKNQDDARDACLAALIFYAVTFLLSFGCIGMGFKDKEQAKLIM